MQLVDVEKERNHSFVMQSLKREEGCLDLLRCSTLSINVISINRPLIILTLKIIEVKSVESCPISHILAMKMFENCLTGIRNQPKAKPPGTSTLAHSVSWNERSESRQALNLG